MSLFVALVIGVAVGTVGGRWFMRNPDYLLINILVGLVGSILGLAVYVLGNPGQSAALFSWGGMILSLLGATCSESFYMFFQSLASKQNKKSE